MKTLLLPFSFLMVCFFSTTISAQCSDIYFYRTNGFQNKKPVMLYSNEKKLATINAGEKYVATVCSEDALEFVVRTSENDMVPSRVTLDPKNAATYYLKISCAVGVEIASIKMQAPGKGKKDIDNGKKFIKPLKKLSVQNETVSQNKNAIIPANNNQTFEATQTVDNFKFEITNVTKAGEQLTIDYKITNLHSDDRRFETCANMIYFYDDLGNLNFANKACVANSCSGMPSWIKSPQVSEKYACHSRVNSNAILPSGIPLKASITIPNIKKSATKFIKGSLWFKSETAYKMDFYNLKFPEIVDADNPNKMNFGNQSIELIHAVNDSSTTYIHFKHSNAGVEPYNLKIKKGVAYDDQGNQYTLNAISFFSKNKRIENRGYFRGWDLTTNPNNPANIFAFIDNMSAQATQIKRITLSFEGFSLSWDNIDIVGATGKKNEPQSSEYIQYSEFEQKVRNKHNVLGTKVILKKIHFSSGSAIILKDSHAQLNQLGDLLKLNPNLKVEVSGHTDNVGDDVSNMVLSQKRADAIKYYLIGRSVLPNRIISIGKGKNEPIKDNTSAQGRQENRRVEIMVIE
ncbi:OmpA family protein [Seonamhaeicola sp.]|uniref:OmpA family protein n=1 Tax=Seonamhaeicola sp. TaxID=1912245 RepID=UPI00260CDD04|nr:OmpA family protein [Seonamhaeicola sp.]